MAPVSPAAKQRRPAIAYLTDRPGTHSLGRKAKTLARGCAELEVAFDAVYLRGDARIVETGPTTREAVLGGKRAATSALRIARYLREVRPQVTIVNSGQLGPFAMVAGMLARSAVVPWELAFPNLDMSELPRRMKPLIPMQNLTYRRAPAILALSEDLASWIVESRGIDRGAIHLLPNPVDLERVRRSAGSEGADREGPFVMSAVGRLVAQKGWDVLLHAVGRHRDELPSGWKLLLVGRPVPAMRSAWEARVPDLVRRYGLDAHVEMLGYQPNPHRMMKRSHLFVHAARWEPFGNVLLEALAVGVPVVATRCPGGPREILGDGEYGRLVPNEDPDALGRALVELAHDPAQRASLARKGIGRAQDYSPRAVVARLRAILEEIDLAQGIQSEESSAHPPGP